MHIIISCIKFFFKLTIIIIFALLIIFYLVNKNNSLFDLDGCMYWIIFIFFIKLTYIKYNYTFFFFFFNFNFFFIFNFFLKKLKIKKKSKIFKFINKFKKIKFKNIFKLTTKLLMYVSCMIFNSLIFCLCKNYFINFYIIKILLLYILIILFYIYVVHFNDLVKLYFNNLFIQIFNYFKKICKNKRKSIMTFYYIILYFIFSYFYNILDNVLFPATTGYFLNNSNLEYFNSIFGNYSIVALVVVFVILLYILTILYFIKLIILVNIFLERLLILFFSDFFFKKYSKYLLKIYFFKSLKIFFYDFKIHKYKVIRKIFNPKFLFKIKYNIYINFIELKLYLIKNYKKDIIFFFIFMFVLFLIFLNL